MNTFYLVRHGEKENVSNDPELTSDGIKNSYKTGVFFRNKNIIKIFSSPLKRTQQTAQEINKSLNVQIEIDTRLRERMNLGDLPNQTLEELLIEWDKSTKNRDYVPLGGISSRQAGNNMRDVLKDVSLKFDNKSFVIVAHGGIIMDFVRNVVKSKKLEEFEKVTPESKGRETSITTVVEKDGKFEVLSVGLVDHLDN